MICKEAERMSINVNPYTRHIESFTQKSKDRVLQTISFEEIKKIKAIRDLPSTLENAKKWIIDPKSEEISSPTSFTLINLKAVEGMTAVIKEIMNSLA